MTITMYNSDQTPTHNTKKKHKHSTHANTNITHKNYLATASGYTQEKT